MIRLRLLPCWGFVLLFVWLSGYWKIMSAIFLMMSIHECAHMIVAYICHYSCDHMDIYPFGFCAQISDIGYGSVYRELLIITAGPCMHLFYPFVFRFFMMHGWISVAFYGYLLMMNQSILFFNLLPILPLDGGRILSEFLHLFLPYAKAQRCASLLSLGTIMLVIICGWMADLIGWLTLMILTVCIQKRMQHLLQDRFRFYRYRYEHPFQGRKIVHHHQDLFRMRTNYIIEGNQMIDEHMWLKRLHQEQEKTR